MSMNMCAVYIHCLSLLHLASQMMIVLKDDVLGLDFHPSTNIVAIGLACGELLMYRYAAEATPKRLLQVKAHTEACEELCFVNEGRAIITSSDCSILSTDVETGSKIARLDHAHGDSINRIANLTESTIASGDYEGCIKVWDIRQRSCSSTFNVHEVCISDMTFASESMQLVATSWDGTLSVYDLRSNKVPIQSEVSKDELLFSVVIMKNGRKVICGTQSGTLLMYSWGFFKDCSDRLDGFSPSSVNVLLKLDEDRIITGSNGIISLVVLPNRVIKPIAMHPSKQSVERLAFSHDKKFLGSISYDETLKVWDLHELLQGCEKYYVASDGDRDEMEVDENVRWKYIV